LQKNSKANQNIPTEFTKFPCPACGIYYEPYMTRRDGKAMCDCPQHGLYETSIAVSKNFRIFCAKVGSAPNRDAHYYTSSEEKIKHFLDHRGLVEGLDYSHNARVRNGRNAHPHKFINEKGKKRTARYVYFWFDFVIPSKKMILEASPSVWHKMWNRESSDQKKSDFASAIGWTLINLDEKDLAQLNKPRTEGKKLGFNPNVKPYHRTENCQKLDSLFGKPQKGGKSIK